MKQICLLCDRTASDNNLYCQEVYCPAEMSPNILDYGEWLGDIEIVKPIVVLRSAVLYEATHQKENVLLKVAHPGDENKERLKREAEFLSKIQAAENTNQYLPTLRPPYTGTTIAKDAYGKAMLKGHLLYFCIFEFFDGEPLRAVLMKNPQLWINHVGWIMLDLAKAIGFLHSEGLYHYCLSPELVLVRFEDNPNVPRVLLYDLGVASDRMGLENSDPDENKWHPSFVLPAYTAPELSDNGASPSYATDVYGLGTTLYEMLVGEPMYSFMLQSDDEIKWLIKNKKRVYMNRQEDVNSVAQIAITATYDEPANRQQHAVAFAESLLEIFGDPPEKKSRKPLLNNIFVIVIAILMIAFLIAVAVSLA